VRFFYNLMRTTEDIDYYLSVPSAINLESLAGRGSTLAKRYKIYLQHVTVTNMPDDYESRLKQMFPRQFNKLHLFAPDPYDLILSKLERNSPKDRSDAAGLFRNLKLDARTLVKRDENELRPYLGNEARESLTLKLWLDIFQENSNLP
jgi:hypothetical protein